MELSYTQMLVLSSAGFGLLFLGAIQLVAGSLGIWPRAAITGLAAIGSALGPVALGESAEWSAALLVGGAWLAFVVLGSRRISEGVASTVGLLRRRAIVAGLLMASGLSLVVGTGLQFELAEDAKIDRDVAWMTEANFRPEMLPTDDASATTDLGRPITLNEPIELRPAEQTTAAEETMLNAMPFDGRLIRRQSATDVSNCHGWVFAAGRFWVGGLTVESILADNGYAPTSEPRAGDLIVYRKQGELTHSGVVRSVGNGIPVLVESKWGWMGVYLHAADDSCYGRDYKFYRSPREGHLLAGLGGPSVKARTVDAATNAESLSTNRTD